jgi:prepilin-type N-terminal cleavage/methylation domain-containing protein
MGAWRDNLRDERGFTLVELLVVMLAGTVVAGALMTIIDVTLHQTTRTFSKVDATQRARTSFSLLENELHSSCVGNGAQPIQTSSSDNTLIFISQYGSAASVTPVEHQVVFNASAKTLVDSTYPVSSGSAPNWVFSTTASSTNTLLTNVAQSGSTPVFQYFAYQVPTDSSGNAYTDSAGNTYEMLLDGSSTVPGTSIIPANSPDPLTTPLSAGDADNAAEVLITLKVGAAGGTNENTSLGTGTVSDAIVMRFTPVANHDGPNQDFTPCA